MGVCHFGPARPTPLLRLQTDLPNTISPEAQAMKVLRLESAVYRSSTLVVPTLYRAYKVLITRSFQVQILEIRILGACLLATTRLPHV